MTRNIAASVHSRLLNAARQANTEFELFLTRYACERFLYRLGATRFGEECILKGAGLLSLWMRDPYRATRDVDLLARGPNDDASIREIVTTICAEPCPEDGMIFDAASLEITAIRAAQEHGGKRSVLWANLGRARIRLQIDFGFGDAVYPGPEDVEYPTLLDGLPAARLRAYPRVVTIAEKFEAMVQLGQRNSRMKDFHDVWALSSTFAFSGPALKDAVVACFTRRGLIQDGVLTSTFLATGDGGILTTQDGSPLMASSLPTALGSSFYADPDLDKRWRGYVRAGAFRQSPPTDFETVGASVCAFLRPIWESVQSTDRFESAWQPGGPWS